ncbi:MAG: VirD4-like conjugal transfer protein, CD1115 family [Anaerovoracaceae bacterium]
MILSKDVVLSMNTRKTMRNNNILVIGGSGTGKSRFMIKPNMLQANSSFVITDPSGELLESMGGFLKEKGYEVRVFNLSQMEHSNCYNPFHYIRNQEGVLSMINALIKNTTPKGSSTNDPFWEKSETALLQAICFFLIAECNPDEQNFSSVMKLLRCVDAGEGSENRESVLDVLMDELREKDPEHIALRAYAVFKSAGGGKTAQSILISCQTRLQMFNLQAISNLTNTDNIDLKSVGDKPTALFCVTKVEDTTFNFLVALLYTQLFETLYDHAKTDCPGLRLPIHVRFLLDEFANIGTIPEFNEKLATMRKHEISCTIVIQALSQLKTMYKDDWEVIVGNCDTLLFLGGSDATTLDYISKKLGKETIRAKNTSRSFGRQGSSSTSFNTTGRELMQPDEISSMDNMNCIVFIRGEAPFYSVKYDYPKHPNYNMTGDADDNKLFDIQKNVHTVATKPEIEWDQAQIKELKGAVKQTVDAVANMQQMQRQIRSEQRKERNRRNPVIRQKELEIAETMDMNADTLDEFNEANNCNVSAADIENRICQRYEAEQIYSVPDDYEEDEYTSPFLTESK